MECDKEEAEEEKANKSPEQLVSRPNGCIILASDAGNVIGSIALFASFLVYGACQGGLGAALPSLAAKFGVSEGRFGFAFTTRGIGYLCGTVGSAFISEVPRFPVSKEVMVCIAVVVTGLATGLIAGVDSYDAVLFLFWVQGFGFGGVDTFANVVLPELWGARVQPWMQALHSFFGVGAVVGPALVGGFGFYIAFIILAIISAVPLVAMALEHLLRTRRCHSRADEAVVGEAYAAAAVEEGCEEQSPAALTECGAPQVAVAVTMSDADAGKGDGQGEGEGQAQEAKVGAEVKRVPLLPRCLITIFFFIYVGAECGYGGWVSTFALQAVACSEAQAAFAASIFWAALTAGRVVAIPQALFVSTTGMLRLQLGLSVLGAILTATIAQLGYAQLCVASAVLGYALSSIFPLAMTLAMDYGLTMDGPTTSQFVIGATFGEGAIPVAIGLAMAAGGSAVLPYCILVSVGLLVLLYLCSHALLRRPSAQSQL